MHTATSAAEESALAWEAIMSARRRRALWSGCLVFAAGCASPEAPPPIEQPPPLSGGTLAIARDGVTAIVSDPDNDRVVLVDLTRRTVLASLPLHPGDEPGRIAEDDARHAYVVLRGGGAVVTVDLTARSLGERRAACPNPRGVAWDRGQAVLHVACMGGELVTLAPTGAAPLRRVLLARDLRDVVVDGDRLLVSRFRAAEVLVLDARGSVTRRIVTPPNGSSTAGVAWRMASSPGGAWLLHQRADTTTPIAVTGPAYYNGPTRCPGTSGATRPAIARVDDAPSDPAPLPDVPNAALAVDVAVAPSGDRLALAIPGALGSLHPQVIETGTRSAPCMQVNAVTQPRVGQVVAVAYTPGGRLVVQTRAPASVVVIGEPPAVPLGGAAVDHVGQRLFHSNPTGAVACAACHVEGEDDGRVWIFDPAGPRRTAHLRGGLLGTEPFHWDGDQPDFRTLVMNVMVRGMRAPVPTDREIASLARWIDRLPRRAAPTVDAAAVARGGVLFHSPSTACATCHAGPLFTDGRTLDVGTGGSFQVPPLHGLAWHAPYLHNGCAPTLRDRFGRCGGGDAHGHTSQLSRSQIDDLVAYLETL